MDSPDKPDSGWCGDRKRGAGMGRASSAAALAAAVSLGHRIHLALVALDSGGYDRGGAYWGANEYGHRGATRSVLYRAWCDGAEGDAQLFVRARDRDDAKGQVAIHVRTIPRWFR